MNNKAIKYSASPREMALFNLVGKAVCKIQFLEDALNHSIVIKNGNYIHIEPKKTLQRIVFVR